MNPSHRIGPIELAPGVRPIHGWTFMYGGFVSIGLLVFITIGQTYILNEHLNIPIEQQGTLSGDLVFWTEIVALLLFIPAGILIDKIGRKPVFVAGMLFLATTYALYPLATQASDLFLYRTIYALGVVAIAGALSTVLADYPAEPSRGKLVAAIGMLNGLGVVLISQGFGAFPELFVAKGFSGIEAGIYTHALVAALALFSALVLAMGLKPGVPVTGIAQPGIKELFTSGFAEARNPRILLSYAAAFIARGDQSINATFVVLWGTTVGITMGLSSAQAITQATIIFVITQISALLSAPFLGPIIDRLNRVTALAICMALAAVGNLAVVLLANPLELPQSILFFVLLGIGQMAVFLGGQSLIGQEAPVAKRGSVLAAFNISGALGILLIIFIGGRLFDQIDPRAPFVLVGCINFLLIFASLWVRWKAPGKSIEEVAQERAHITPQV
ncbi:Predicted arabinose efflux permease, MFS family [Ectothiorhodosinus mongolicus]|uniref:Predicted arabinose efflux permease, MFS family n=1 Tax=Ectothiorhodosinus mongolicus TaxID=233100 RepID=A0A1R3VZK2_9GAMM|nr:MFS transporter [Ectothiorhodosinus mongolicus]ULX57111.1 MFS transporter [Ectothiorhodosinus mongolicus]SIT69981.1 Predicted arabinose efflux permease, MFS family [Ectothiorhodosinus mongolicus]